MKLFSIPSSLNSRARSLNQRIRIQFLHTEPKRTRSSKNVSVSDSLYRRVSRSGDPSVSVVPILDQWIKEGNYTYKLELQRVITGLTTYRRFKHALEVSLWMTNKRGFPVASFDVAVRLKLIFKIFGLEQVENYFDKIPENLKTYRVYLALLNCYTIAKSVDKAESTMQKIRDLGYASKATWYNLLMNMHYQLGNKEKLCELLAEMETKGICYDEFTYSVCLSACAMDSDAVGVDKVVKMMESDERVDVHWRTYAIAAQSCLRIGLVDKALVLMNKLEGQLRISEQKNILYIFLLTLYGEIGKKDEVYRIWKLYKRNGKGVNKVYMSMMRSLMKFDDIEGAEKIFQEWELSGMPYDFRIPNILIDAYSNDGRLEKAEALITEGIAKGGEPRVVTWCHLAGGYLKKHEHNKAVESLEKAISICPPKFSSHKNSLSTCLEYLENGECLQKVEELLKILRNKPISSDTVFDDFSDLLKEGESKSCGQDQESSFIMSSN